MVILYHYTAPYAARSIAERGTYYGGVCFEDGINTVPANGPWRTSTGYSCTGAQSTDALLELEWTGPVVTRPYARTIPNTLYDLGSHRLFIPAGTTQHLRLIGMQLHPKLHESAWIGPPPQTLACVWRPGSWRFIFEILRKRETIRWREHDFDSARKIISYVNGEGVALVVRSETERPWAK